MQTRITELLNIKYPIFQGGMAWVADGDLAGAVSKAGGLGIIGGGNAPKEVETFSRKRMVLVEKVSPLAKLVCNRLLHRLRMMKNI